MCLAVLPDEAGFELLCHSRQKQKVSQLQNGKAAASWQAARATGRLACKSCLKLLLPPQLNFLIKSAPSMVSMQVSQATVQKLES